MASIPGPLIGPVIPRTKAGVLSRIGRDNHSQLSLWFWEIDRVLLLLVAVLIGIGLIAVAAASPAAGQRYSGGSVRFAELHYFYRQLMWIAVSLPVTAQDREKKAEPKIEDPPFRALDSNLYMQTAAEYRACCHQAYNLALERLRQHCGSLAPGSKPPAVIMDLDETVFDNAGYLSQKSDVMTYYPDGAAARSGRFAGTGITPRPEYAKLAEAYGGYGEKVARPQDVAAALERGLEQQRRGRLALVHMVLN